MMFVVMSEILETQPRETNQKNGSTGRVKTTKDGIVSFVIRHSGCGNSHDSDNKEGVNSEIKEHPCKRSLGS